MAEGKSKKSGCCTRHPIACGVCLLVAAAISLGVAGTAIGIRPVLHKMFKDTVDKQVQLVPDSEGTSQFKKSSAPLYTKFYFFNVTNQDEVVKTGAHPIVAQVGPYTYREWRTKFNLKWNNNDTIVNYHLNVTYTLEPTRSSGDPKKDKITTLNIPLYVLFLKLEELEPHSDNKYIEDLINFILKEIDELAEELTHEPSLFMTTTVDDLLFGYNDKLLSELHKLLEDFFPQDAGMINPFFGLENRTEIDTDNAVYTGKGDISRVGQYVKWNGHTEIFEHGGWGTYTAKMINGTGGFLFAPDVKRHHNLTAFISELYRSGYFSYKEDVNLYGVTAYRYVLPEDELISANQDPGFYPNGPNGVLNLTAVFTQNAPVFASKPHFLDADPGYVNNVTGLYPNRELHDSYLDVEPITGAVIRAAKRIQINLQLKRTNHFRETEDIMPQLMMPVFWASEEGSLTHSLANKFKGKVYGPKYGMEAGVWGGVGLGGLVFLMSVTCIVGVSIQQCRYRRRHRGVVAVDDERTSLLN